MSDQIEPCTTRSRDKRHFSDRLRPHRPRGRSGATLCRADGYDEDRANWLATAGWNGKPIRLADLPECKLCARSKAKREREASGED